MGHNAHRDVAIIGGGIGGLTAALAFARRGAKVTVYEQASALTEVGAGLQITPNGARALNKLGIGPALDAVGITAQAVTPMDAIAGQQIARFDLSQQDPPYRFYHRAALLDLLARGCATTDVTIKLNARIGAIRPDGGFDADGVRQDPDLTIGADGLHSVVRDVLNKPTQPFFTGQTAWRAIIKSPQSSPVARIWMAPGRHVVTYPLSGGRLNIVAVQERSDWAAEGWHHSDTPQNLQRAFSDCSPQLQDILQQVEDVRLWGLFRHPVATRWQRGNMAILGDAAHPTLPFLAQGANLAIEDAYVLARLCDENARVHDGVRDYQAARRPRVVRAIAAANANAKNYHLSGIKRTIAHTGLRVMGAVAPNAFLRRLAWLYDHDVTV